MAGIFFIPYSTFSTTLYSQLFVLEYNTEADSGERCWNFHFEINKEPFKMRCKLVVIHTGISPITIITLNHQSVHYESCICISYPLRKKQKTKNKNNSKEDKSHLPLCSDTQMMMNNVKDLHTEKAIVIPSLMRWCVRGAAAVDQ